MEKLDLDFARADIENAKTMVYDPEGRGLVIAAALDHAANACDEIDALRGHIEQHQPNWKRVWDALEPVRDWYDGEGARHDVVAIIKDVVADLQTDRAAHLKLIEELETTRILYENNKKHLESKIRGLQQYATPAHAEALEDPRNAVISELRAENIDLRSWKDKREATDKVAVEIEELRERIRKDGESDV